MKEAFSEPLNSLDEYWAGYFRADGTIYKEYSSGFSQKDEDVVYALAKYISHKGKIHNIRCKTTFGDQEITRFSSTAITKNLIKLGVKTNLKEDLYLSKHFWRGMVDGDGSVMINGRGQPVLSLCGWLRDIEEFSKYIENLLNIPGPKVYPSKSIWYTRVGGSKAKRLGLHLYEGEYSANKRKMNIALSYRNK